MPADQTGPNRHEPITMEDRFNPLCFLMLRWSWGRISSNKPRPPLLTEACDWLRWPAVVDGYRRVSRSFEREFNAKDVKNVK